MKYVLGLIDTHCHLTDPKYNYEEIEDIIKQCKNNNVSKLICVGVNFNDSMNAFAFASQYNQIFCSFGLHPSDILQGKSLSKNELHKIKKLVNHESIVAIGECGLDYSYENANLLENKKKQIKEYEKQIKLSIELKLPLIIHTRKSHDDNIKILKKYPLAYGVIHCFNGSLEIANEYIKMGFYISFSGLITFKNTLSLQNVATKIPLNKILIETDSPYITPEPYRKTKKNYPYHIRTIALKLARLRNISYDEIMHVTTLNAESLFKI